MATGRRAAYHPTLPTGLIRPLCGDAGGAGAMGDSQPLDMVTAEDFPRIRQAFEEHSYGPRASAGPMWKRCAVVIRCW